MNSVISLLDGLSKCSPKCARDIVGRVAELKVIELLPSMKVRAESVQANGGTLVVEDPGTRVWVLKSNNPRQVLQW